ncbi:ABC transporter substrate-binding protein [Pseudomonas gingeri]|uniref:ABC transporter substrate-binding protein n=1 Tax=Pseudomonas gingeri TaxID=117681 RepID=UPI0015A4387F|nr:ABC transporter substrate-binding protein [Pseudomonas gingeri]NWD06933.1 ABC transporter substrate-binding protein [Pseudomonas gingeri]NWD48245.1 ABC transporter substrate-binding protein [Pseudomonas gingeri]NWE26561.1 ABC transporter substrate-binding protein [Pseudomonas gingeri]NWE31531.1 ABC transporter substrate-binding protein [Pseudomonas gingeri]NWE57451.1 ABC transporter substrate-binding protein [Pseudomonas gingeri]
MSAQLSRRRILQWMASAPPALWMNRPWASMQPPTPSRIIPLSWELAETLLALGHAPIALPLPDWYTRTIVEPPLPEGVVDIGLLYQPSFELLRQLTPDLLILTPGHIGLKPMLERLAPTVTFGAYMSTARPYPALQQETRRMARVLDCLPRAESLLAETEQVFETVSRCLAVQPAVTARPTFVADAVDEYHLRVYGAGSLFDTVLARIGVSNAAHPVDVVAGGWSSNSAGYALVPLQRLAGVPEANLLLVGPVASNVQAALQQSPVWRAMPCVREGRVARLPVIAPYGGLVSLQRFARAVAVALYRTAHQEPASV